jgi:hypothetical protein
MANLIELNLGEYKIQFDQTQYNVEQKENAALVTAKDKPNLKAIVSIIEYPKKLSGRYELEHDTTVLALENGLIRFAGYTSIAPPPTPTTIDNRDGFFINETFTSEPSIEKGYVVRAGFWLDDRVMCSIISVNDENPVGLINTIMRTIHVER